jgi:hypothetical protein
MHLKLNKIYLSNKKNIQMHLNLLDDEMYNLKTSQLTPNLVNHLKVD